MAEVLGTIFVCDDCMFVHANGETGPTDCEPWGLMPTADVAMNCEGDGEDCGFSWSSCDGCGSRLGGTRHRMTVFGWGEGKGYADAIGSDSQTLPEPADWDN